MDRTVWLVSLPNEKTESRDLGQGNFDAFGGATRRVVDLTHQLGLCHSSEVRHARKVYIT